MVSLLSQASLVEPLTPCHNAGQAFRATPHLCFLTARNSSRPNRAKIKIKVSFVESLPFQNDLLALKNATKQYRMRVNLGALLNKYCTAFFSVYSSTCLRTLRSLPAFGSLWCAWMQGAPVSLYTQTTPLLWLPLMAAIVKTQSTLTSTRIQMNDENPLVFH